MVALVQQAFLLVLAALMLDGGRLLRAIACVLIGSWLVSLVVMLWYREHLTPLSIAVIKFGFWLAIVMLLLLGRLAGLPVFGS